jgi:hypothetical protein
MHTYLCMHIHMYMKTGIYIFKDDLNYKQIGIYVYIHINIHMYAYVYLINIYMHIYICIHIHIYMKTGIYVFKDDLNYKQIGIYIFIYMYAHIYIIFIYIHIVGEKYWDYCSVHDRRFHKEILNDIPRAGIHVYI